MTTTENNELLAKFLGYTQPHSEYPDSTYWHKKGEAPLTILLFDTDWNWLMQVVEKIEILGYDVMVKGISCTISPLLNEETIVQIVLGNRSRKIELVYSACVEFVKWYNENN